MNRLLTTVMVGLAGFQGITLAGEQHPKLVVGIVVDQLRGDYLENLKDMLSPGGFRRLMDQGLYFKDLDFKAGNDPASASAVILSGSYPRQNGIPGSYIYDPATKSMVPVFSDDAYIGNFTSEKYSPAALRVTTITDELTVDQKGKTRIHSIAPDAAQAIVLAGHTGNSAFWVNDETGRWASTTYYSNPPATLQNINYNSPLVARLDTMKWVPLHKNEPYPGIDDAEIKEGFKYTFSRSDKDVFTHYKLSPYVNSDITAAAGAYISELSLGKPDVRNDGKTQETVDVLNLGYTLAPFPGAGSGYKYALQDAYLRLDKNLESLFNTLDRQVGKDNFVVYLVSTGYFEEPERDLAQYRLPGGSFSVKRALSLLNAYLSAKYGNGAYVDQYSNSSIHLSKKTIEEKGLDVNQVVNDSRDFLIKMSGISDAYTLSELMTPGITELEGYREAYDPKTSGDIILEFTPGWTVIDDSRFPAQTQPNKTSIYPAPGFILGTGIAAKTVETPVDATSIAPTLARTLRIRAPNASK